MTQDLLIQAAQAEKANNLIQADKLYDEALAKNTNYETLIASYRVAKKLGNHQKAANVLEAAYRLQPSHNLRFELAVAYLDAGKLNAAEEIAREGLKKKPKDFGLANAYGVILKRLGRSEEAIEYFLLAAKIEGTNSSPPVNLGNTYMMVNKPAKAVEWFSKATRLNPKDGENFRLLANAHIRLGDYPKGISTLEQALVRSPKNIKARIDIFGIYLKDKDYSAALHQLELGFQSFPNHPLLIRNKVILLRRMGQHDEALQLLEELLKQEPNNDETLAALGDLYYQSLGNREKANFYYNKALLSNPQNFNAAAQYCECLLNSRYGSEAEHIAKAYEVACNLLENQVDTLKIAASVQGIFLRLLDYDRLAQLGDRKKLLSYWLTQMNVGELHNQLGRVQTIEDRLELVSMHRAWGDKIDAIAAKNPIIRHSSPHSSDKIRIGIMSSDLRNHPVTYFVLPILKYYDRSKFELYCYSFYQKEADMMQQKIVEMVDSFNLMPYATDQAVAQKIADDKIDILFELGGTTLMNKIEVCSYRPAPIQVSWLGYPHSSGLSTIDYILVDPYINPEQPGLLIERPFLLPESWVSLDELGFYDIPIEPGIPEQKNGWVTFGTANNPYKYTPKCFETWAAIMRQVPNSRFLFIRPEGDVEYFKQNAIGHFTKHGIEAERIVFSPIRGKHMPHYNKIDIALDPFPHVGGTTTCEALWMGVPTITLVGPAFFERLSYSNLSNAGLGECCAFDLDSYISKAVTLANDPEKRLYLRHHLRQQISENPLGQPERFVRNFEQKILEIMGKA
jgi:predicted O-linked N-acetylglucosamine transferase (SPINDLY family)